MHDALGNALVVEVGDLLTEVEVFHERRAALAGLERVVGVRNPHALVGGQVLAVSPGGDVVKLDPSAGPGQLAQRRCDHWTGSVNSSHVQAFAISSPLLLSGWRPHRDSRPDIPLPCLAQVSTPRTLARSVRLKREPVAQTYTATCERMPDQGVEMQQPRSTPPLQIAVINDDTAFLELMRDLLKEDGGYDAVICREWDNAHGFVKDKRPALVILDIRIGGEEHGWTILNLLTLDPKRARFQ